MKNAQSAGQTKAVGYVRVSTQRQGETGSGLEGQKEAIRAFVHANDWDLLDTYPDVWTGAGPDSFRKRPNLLRALKHAQKENAYIIMDSWSRLTRHAASVADIRQFIPDERRLISIHEENTFEDAVRAGQFARDQFNRDHISLTTKAGMAKAKANGMLPGNPEIEKAQKKGASAVIDKKEAITGQIVDILRALERDHSKLSAQDVADVLNQHGLLTGQGLEWNKSRVHDHLRAARKILNTESYANDPGYGLF